MAGINGLQAAFNMGHVGDVFENFLNDANDKILQSLRYLGEEFVNKARLSGNYTDRTANLRSSIGYIILKDGQVIEQNFGGNVEGVSKGQEVAEKIALDHPYGWVLIGVAGMEYAASVEAHNFDVITGSAPTKQMLKSILSEINL